MTFSALLTEIYGELGYQSSPASDVVARVKRYVNEGIRVVMGEPGLIRLSDSVTPITIASVASQAQYAVPEAAARIQSITERTNDRSLRAMSRNEYRRLEPDPSSITGLPTHYVP